MSKTKNINFADSRYISTRPAKGKAGASYLRSKLPYFQYRNDKAEDQPLRQVMDSAATNAVKSPTLQVVEATLENPGAGARSAAVKSSVKQTLQPAAAGHAAVVKSSVKSTLQTAPKEQPIIDWLLTNPDKRHPFSRKIAARIGHVSPTHVARSGCHLCAGRDSMHKHEA